MTVLYSMNRSKMTSCTRSSTTWSSFKTITVIMMQTWNLITGCDDWVRGWGWRWLQDHRRKQRKAFAGEISKICFISLENVTLHWNILFINLENVTLQGPLDTDILREYIKARSPLNYKWGPDTYNQQGTAFISWANVSFWKLCLICSRRVEERIAMRTTHGDQFSNFSFAASSSSAALINQLLYLQIQYYVLKRLLCWKYIFILPMMIVSRAVSNMLVTVG